MNEENLFGRNFRDIENCLDLQNFPIWKLLLEKPITSVPNAPRNSPLTKTFILEESNSSEVL